MKRLSQSRTSKKYLEEKFEQKAEPLTEEMQKKLEEASEAANLKIARNNSVYQQSNRRSHLYPTEKGSNEDCILATDFNQVDRKIEESKFELATNSVPRKDSLEKSSFSLVKKIEKRFKK